MISDYAGDELLNWLKGNAFDTAPTALYLSLHDGNPGPDGTANDVTVALAGARAQLLQSNLGSPADRSEGGRQVSSQNDLTFTNSALAGGSVSHIGLWDAVTGGNFLAGDTLESVANVLTGDIIRIPTGQLQLIAIGFPDP